MRSSLGFTGLGFTAASLAERTVVVPGGWGVHARPVVAAWRAARRYRSDVRIEGRECIEGREWSVHLNTAEPSTLPYRIGVLQGMNNDRSGRVTVKARGPDASEALAAVVAELEHRYAPDNYRRWRS